MGGRGIALLAREANPVSSAGRTFVPHCDLYLFCRRHHPTPHSTQRYLSRAINKRSQQRIQVDIHIHSEQIMTKYGCMCGAYEGEVTGDPALACWCHCEMVRSVSFAKSSCRPASATSLASRSPLTYTPLASSSNSAVNRLAPRCSLASGALTSLRFSKAMTNSSSIRVRERSFVILGASVDRFVTKSCRMETLSIPWGL